MFKESYTPAHVHPVIIPLKENVSIHSYPYHLAKPQQHTLLKLLASMIKNGVVSPTGSDISYPVVLVKKKNGDFRFCVDYRKLNQHLVPDHYPLPLIKDVHDCMGGAAVFTTLDLKSGYWQLPVQESDRYKTAFTTHVGMFAFNVLPFGLCTAPSIFQRTMYLVLSGLKYDHVLVYIDDLIIFSHNEVEHALHLDSVLTRLEEHGIRVGLPKCSFIQHEVHFLGHVVSGQGLRPDENLIKTVRDWPEPTNVDEVRSFIALCEYYRQFNLHFADLAEPLSTCKVQCGF